MEIEILVRELTSDEPDFEVIMLNLNKHPELVRGIIWDNASILHIAARNDVIHGTQIVPWLMENFDLKPNSSNDGGSVPLFWALAAYEEMKDKGLKYHLRTIEFLVHHERFNFDKVLINRGMLEDFIIRYYNFEEIIGILNPAKYNKMCA